jgi:YVTN family beta-propeller protein
MPQDIRISADGKLFYVADMMADGVFVIDGDAFKEVDFVKTGIGTHGLYPSRDGTKLYVTNRGSNKIHGPAHGKGSVSVLDFATRKVEATWPIPGGGSPDMGNVSADGKYLWLAGRYDNVVYVIDTTKGSVNSIPVGKEPHGLTVWPAATAILLGHTGASLTVCGSIIGTASFDSPRCANKFAPTDYVMTGAITVTPPIYGCSTAGTSTPPSAR